MSDRYHDSTRPGGLQTPEFILIMQRARDFQAVAKLNMQDQPGRPYLAAYHEGVQDLADKLAGYLQFLEWKKQGRLEVKGTNPAPGDPDGKWIQPEAPPPLNNSQDQGPDCPHCQPDPEADPNQLEMFPDAPKKADKVDHFQFGRPGD